jgi:hypothetical protein
MSWDPQDQYGFIYSVHNNIGQITLEQQIGKALKDISALATVKTILEIGTWNGLGSTKCIIEGLKTRDPTSYIFYSLEANSEKCAFAHNLYKNMPSVHILNEVIYNEEPADQYEIFPELKENKTYDYWHRIDMENMQTKPLFLSRTGLPGIFDVLLLDGGEFTTWYEYNALKDRCRILVLDDTNVCKCRRIVDEIKSQPEKWQVILETNERNGNLIAMRKDL